MDASTFQKKLATAFPGYLGIEFQEVTTEKVTASLEVRPEMCNGGDILHGGAIMSLADTLGAVGTIVNLPKGARTTTIESKTNFLGAAKVGERVAGESVPLHRGKTTMVWQTTVRLANGRLCAIVTQTQLVLPGSRE